MKLTRIAVALVAAASLTACAGLSTLPGPAPTAEVLDQTPVDEQALLTATAAYVGLGTLVEGAVDAGLLRGDRAAQVAQLERRAYAALEASRAAYRAGNARDGATQALAVSELVAQALAIVRLNPD